MILVVHLVFALSFDLLPDLIAMAGLRSGLGEDAVAAEGRSNLDPNPALDGATGDGGSKKSVTPESGDGDVAKLMGRLKLTSKEAKPFVLNVEEGDIFG